MTKNKSVKHNKGKLNKKNTWCLIQVKTMRQVSFMFRQEGMDKLRDP